MGVVYGSTFLGKKQNNQLKLRIEKEEIRSVESLRKEEKI